MREETTGGHFAAAALDVLDFGVFTLDEQHRLRHANALGRVMLARGHPLAQLGNTLAGCNHRVQIQLEGVFQRAESGGAAAVALGRPRERGRLYALARQLRAPGREEFHFLLVVSTARWVVDPLLLGQVFGLTPAEAAVASALARGRKLAEHAAGTGVAISTLRSQLKQVLAKTGAKGQVDLVRMLAQLPRLR